MTLRQIYPLLFASSIERLVDFYRDVLGFELKFAMTGDGGTMMHASVSSGDIELMIGCREGDSVPPGGGAELYITMDGVDEYYEGVRSAGATITQEIADQFWGDRTFTVVDPDGYVLTFAQVVRAWDPERDVPVAATA